MYLQQNDITIQAQSGIYSWLRSPAENTSIELRTPIIAHKIQGQHIK